jgi:hypothetical protein
MPRRKFTAEEDMRLRGLVEQYGCNNWKVVATQMLWRDAKQCREHWKNYLSPSINLAPWTDEEEELLKEKVAELGPKWAKIAKFFSGRTDTNIKNRWGAMQLRQQRLLQ